jgi:hypothetical protein
MSQEISPTPGDCMPQGDLRAVGDNSFGVLAICDSSRTFEGTKTLWLGRVSGRHGEFTEVVKGLHHVDDGWLAVSASRWWVFWRQETERTRVWARPFSLDLEPAGEPRLVFETSRAEDALSRYSIAPLQNDSVAVAWRAPAGQRDLSNLSVSTVSATSTTEPVVLFSGGDSSYVESYALTTWAGKLVVAWLENHQDRVELRVRKLDRDLQSTWDASERLLMDRPTALRLAPLADKLVVAFRADGRVWASGLPTDDSKNLSTVCSIAEGLQTRDYWLLETSSGTRLLAGEESPAALGGWFKQEMLDGGWRSQRCGDSR